MPPCFLLDQSEGLVLVLAAPFAVKQSEQDHRATQPRLWAHFSVKAYRPLVQLSRRTEPLHDQVAPRRIWYARYADGCEQRVRTRTFASEDLGKVVEKAVPDQDIKQIVFREPLRMRHQSVEHSGEQFLQRVSEKLVGAKL